MLHGARWRLRFVAGKERRKLAEPCVGILDVALSSVNAAPERRRRTNIVPLVVVAVCSEGRWLAWSNDLAERLRRLLDDPISPLSDEGEVRVIQDSGTVPGPHHQVPSPRLCAHLEIVKSRVVDK